MNSKIDKQVNTIETFRRVTHESMGYMRSKLEIFGLYRGQPKMLYVLSKDDGLTKKELAQRFDVAAPTITKMVERLEKNGFVYTGKDENDKRITRVFISEKGRDVQRKLVKFHDEAADVYFKGMSDEEVETLNTLLLKVRSNIQETGMCCGHGHSHKNDRK